MKYTYCVFVHYFPARCSQDTDHNYKRHKKLIQTTKKVGCPVVAIVREILAFPTFTVINLIVVSCLLQKKILFQC